MAKSNRDFAPDYAVPPGETLRETIAELAMTQVELARRTGRPEKTISEIINGKAAIMPETAIQFERVLGIPTHVWLNLEANFQETKARLASTEKLEHEAQRVKDFPYAEMGKLGWVPKTRDRLGQAENLMRFLGIASFGVLDTDQAPAAAYRVASCKEPSGYALAAWLRAGELAAQRIEVEPFEAHKLRKNLPVFRDMTRQMDQEFQGELEKLCAKCGIAVVLLPHLKGTYAQGATRWLTPGKALIQLTIRYKHADIFWFSFFHEVGHLLLHGKRDIFVRWEQTQQDDVEREADQFAADTLIPPNWFAQLYKKAPYSRATILTWAKELGVGPGIIVGRLQYEGLLPHDQLNDLRIRFQWAAPES